MIVDGRQKVIAAISTGPALDQWADVRVVEVQDDNSLVVEKAN